jgi:hypothetical protein
MNSASPCSICKENGHSAKKCPSLHDVLKEGFYSGGGGGGGHSHDDDDERAKALTNTHIPPPAILPTSRSR